MVNNNYGEAGYEAIKPSNDSYGEAGYKALKSQIIDNDFHPVDSDMSATEDHWGTVKNETSTVNRSSKGNMPKKSTDRYVE